MPDNNQAGKEYSVARPTRRCATKPALRRRDRTTYRFPVVTPSRSWISRGVIPGLVSISATTSRWRAFLPTGSSGCLTKRGDSRAHSLPRLQDQHAVTKLSNPFVPPSTNDSLWSTSSRTLGAACPQYWQVKPSLSKTLKRIAYHRCSSNRFCIALHLLNLNYNLTCRMWQLLRVRLVNRCRHFTSILIYRCEVLSQHRKLNVKSAEMNTKMRQPGTVLSGC